MKIDAYRELEVFIIISFRIIVIIYNNKRIIISSYSNIIVLISNFKKRLKLLKNRNFIFKSLILNTLSIYTYIIDS